MNAPVRIAMWSGPRNISTAMMRAFENREDTVVVDEPFYAHYLAVTGLDHPGRDAVLASQPTDWREVAAELNGPVPEDRPVWYQKHMAHHFVGGMDHGWLAGFVNCFLIRAPEEMVASYVRTRPEITAEAFGLSTQVALYDFVAQETGAALPVLDARDVLEDPEAMLTELCRRAGISFSERMLAWPAGPRLTDGVWAPHWYDAVIKSTGFNPYREREVHLTDREAAIAEELRPHYEYLWQQRIILEAR